MKNVTVSALIAFISISSLLISCKEDESSNPTPNPNSSTAFSVSVNGTLYSTDTANFDVEQNNIQIFAGKNQYQNTMIIDISSINTGTFSFGLNHSLSYRKKTGPNLFDFVIYETGTKGSINITSIDTANNVKGTFSCTAYNINNPNDSVVLSNGTFSLNRE
jgi:Family of unknown function (DUF6252)